ncbi:aldo/keto reductase [Kitasatospora sp. NBC_00240]|uniref:aldo/keto reductase n=1 Tax=Kitasatospora sp. NBC_00240 TaxID=2903567 RepID=UPI002252E0FD|nr:aldo/keto reductase [Kitasatospora sp. NBC_00240]MCX5213760.1 aldo/keto reductase [Kitasatospora sp. NBC_00240]
MRSSTLGAGGPEVGVVGLGCMGMTWAYDPSGRDDATSTGVIRAALDLGVTLIDTADVYGPYSNEELVGAALGGGYRERAVLATKVGLVVSDGERPVVNNGRPDHIRRSIDESLRRLGTDHVDLYQLHRVDPEVPIEESWGALAEVVAAGKARQIGLSEVSVEQIERARAVHPVASVQSELSLWTRDALAEVLPYTEAHGIAFLPFSPLGRGFLAGRFSSSDDLPADDFRRALPRFQREALAANQAIVAGVGRIADRRGATPAQVALAWVLAQGRLVLPIPGTKTPKYLADNAASADLLLTAGDLAELDGLPAPTGTRY